MTATVEFHDEILLEVDHGNKEWQDEEGYEAQGERGKGWNTIFHGQHNFEIFTPESGHARKAART